MKSYQTGKRGETELKGKTKNFFLQHERHQNRRLLLEEKF